MDNENVMKIIRNVNTQTVNISEKIKHIQMEYVDAVRISNSIESIEESMRALEEIKQWNHSC